MRAFLGMVEFLSEAPLCAPISVSDFCVTLFLQLRCGERTLGILSETVGAPIMWRFGLELTHRAGRVFDGACSLARGLLVGAGRELKLKAQRVEVGYGRLRSGKSFFLCGVQELGALLIEFLDACYGVGHESAPVRGTELKT